MVTSTGCCSPSGGNDTCNDKSSSSSIQQKSNGCCGSSSKNESCRSSCDLKDFLDKQNNDNGCCGNDSIEQQTKPCCDVDGGGSCCNGISNNIEAKSCCDAKSGNSSCCGGPTSISCLAILSPDNSTLDVFDVKGQSKKFILNNNGRMKKDLSNEKVCLATHHGNNNMASGRNDDIDMLTWCFDKHGVHDEPDEGCPCGEEEPHIHAHIYNPDICGIDDCCMDDATRKKATNWNFLSQLTYYLEDDSGKGDANKKAGHTHMPINESLPAHCNSTDMADHLSQRGLKLSHWLTFRNRGRSEERCNDSNCGVASCKDHMYPIQHEDHVDFLIHNETTGALHLEHPCKQCGENDLHGTFRLLSTRKWVTEEDLHINLHFFQVHEEPFRILDVLSDLFELESARTQHARVQVVEDTSSRVGRSNFYVKEGLCCASEVPQIKAILTPLDTVEVISVNATTKQVIVDHNVDVIPAVAIASVLNAQGFITVIKSDAALAIEQTGIPTDVFVNSEFDVTTVLEDTKKDDRDKIAEVIQGCLFQKFTQNQVKNVSMNEQKKLLTISHNPYYITAPGIVKALSTYMYEVEIVSDGGADGTWALSSMRSETEESIEHQHSTVRWTVVLSGVFWVISMFSYAGGDWQYLKYVALLSVAFGLPSIAMKAFRTLRRLHFDVNCMMLFAAVGALALQDYTEAAAVTFLFAISEALEQRCTLRARNALSEIVSLRPEYANIINPVTSSIVVLPANCVAVGSSVSVRPGDKIPCDGIVIDGKSAIDESSLTGESRPVNKSSGSRVSGGTINIGDCRIVVKTTATSNDSAVARLIRLIEEAQSNRSDTEKTVDSFAKIYTPLVVLAALCMCTFPWIIDKSTGAYWAKNGLITIVIACPCALIISTPVTYVAGLAATSQRGVIVKGGQHLESAGKVKSIAFDKTGTLSQGVFELLHFNVVGLTRSREEVLGYLALVEAPASHPLSDAIVKGATNEQVDIPKLSLSNHTLLPGEGITATVEGKAVHVGNKKLFMRLGLYDNLSDDTKEMENEWASSGGTTGFISIEGEGIVGLYCVSDKIREESKEVVSALRKMGIGMTMLTGDARPAAVGIGNQIGLREQDIRSELLPQDKLVEITNQVKERNVEKKCWKSKGTVMFCGDGVNDAPALALADISVAMGEGAALALETADITLMDSNLNKLLDTIRMGRRVIRTIAENVIFSLTVKAIVMGFAFAGKASLWAAITSDVGAMLIVTLNGMKLLPSSKKLKNNHDAKSGSPPPVQV